jgi:hypothetical protein
MRFVTEHLIEMVERDQLYLFLTGEGVYRYTPSYMDMPTDTELIVNTIGEYYRLGHPEIISSFKAAVLQVSREPAAAWLAPYYCDEYLWLLKNHHIPDEDALAFVGSVLNNLLKIKEFLMADRRWIGENFKNGLWGDVLRMVKVISNSFAGVPADISGFR